MRKLQDKIAECGLGYHHIIIDGEFHRFIPKGDKNKSGWYIVHNYPDCHAGAYGCFKRDINEKFFELKSKNYTAKQKCKDEIKRRVRMVAEQMRIHTRNQDAQLQAQDLWNKSQKCNTHPYLKDKKIQETDLRTDGYDNLLLPMYDIEGELCNIQKINRNGGKYFSKGAKTKGCFYPIGDFVNCKTIILCEGPGTGLTIQSVTGLPTVVCFGANNLLLVGQAIRGKYPDAKIIYAADDDQYGDKNTGKINATVAAQATGGIVVLPQFACIKTKPTDFNDLYILEGSDAVNSQLGRPNHEL